MRVSWVSLAVFIGSVFAQSSTVDSYIATESPIAKTGLLANIGGSGSKAAGAKVSKYTPIEFRSNSNEEFLNFFSLA